MFGYPRRFNIYRRVGHPRMERVLVTGGEDVLAETMWLVDGERCKDEAAALAQLAKVESSYIGFGSPTMSMLRGGGAIRWVHPPETGITGSSD